MATESHQEAEVDLGFRHRRPLPASPATAASFAEENLSPLRAAGERFKTLRIFIVIALSAAGGLLCSIALFNTVEPANRIVHWRRSAGFSDATPSATAASVAAENKSNPAAEANLSSTPIPQVLPPRSLFSTSGPELFAPSNPDYSSAATFSSTADYLPELANANPAAFNSATNDQLAEHKAAPSRSHASSHRRLATRHRKSRVHKLTIADWWKSYFQAPTETPIAKPSHRATFSRSSSTSYTAQQQTSTSRGQLRPARKVNSISR